MCPVGRSGGVGGVGEREMGGLIVLGDGTDKDDVGKKVKKKVKEKKKGIMSISSTLHS
jgi:hypothetical protein